MRLRRDEQDDPRILQAMWYRRLHAWLSDRDISVGFDDGETWRGRNAGTCPAGQSVILEVKRYFDVVGVSEFGAFDFLANMSAALVASAWR
ncbi:hypothetical protein A6U98_13865 [Rhizobium sp. WYCCWR10014]|nr:hypothetical protein A6U98_13865 [Rhizobium sp. WYCCWR10014]